VNVVVAGKYPDGDKVAVYLPESRVRNRARPPGPAATGVTAEGAPVCTSSRVHLFRLAPGQPWQWQDRAGRMTAGERQSNAGPCRVLVRRYGKAASGSVSLPSVAGWIGGTLSS